MPAFGSNAAGSASSGAFERLVIGRASVHRPVCRNGSVACLKMALASGPSTIDDPHMNPRQRLLTAFLSSLVALAPGWTGQARAQTAPVAKPPPCAAAPHRQFDFWLGQWEVRDPTGKVVGHNRIETAHGGCALIEHWTSVTGVT